MPITIRKINEVVEVKKRLDRVIGPALIKLKSELGGDNKDYRLFLGSKETAALRRASMDLTRALADLRRP